MHTKPILDKREALAGHFLFSRLEADQLDQLLTLGRERRYGNGQRIFSKGEPGGSMVLVLQGLVRVSTCSNDGKELILSFIPTGGCLGEVALLDGKGRTADAVAIGDCVLFIITRADFIAFLERHPRVAIALLNVLGERLRHADEFVENLAFLNLPARLSRLLLKLAASYGKAAAGGLRIDFKLSQQDLGNLVATSRESVNKQLRGWQEEGMLDHAHGYITILQPEQLKKIAETDG
jgi:CRP-like cAMP-binding protein